MKRLIFTTLFLFGASLYAQDIITLRNGNEVRARITEISATEIRYLRFDNLDGPMRIIPRSDVFFIVYEDGTQEIVTPLSEPSVATPIPQAEQPVPQRATAAPNISRCNSNMPGWGSTLGIVSFVSDSTWKVIGNGITQEWSDAIQATACDKRSFSGSSRGNFNSDCRSNSNQRGDLFSWCAVVLFQQYLCPYPWRVPTAQDFIDLDVALGGTGKNRQHYNLRQPQQGSFGYSNWLAGRAFDGKAPRRHMMSLGNFWSISSTSDVMGVSLSIGLRLFLGLEVSPQEPSNKGNGLGLRCVR